MVPEYSNLEVMYVDEGNGKWFATIPSLEGVFSNGATKELAYIQLSMVFWTIYGSGDVVPKFLPEAETKDCFVETYGNDSPFTPIYEQNTFSVLLYEEIQKFSFKDYLIENINKISENSNDPEVTKKETILDLFNVFNQNFGSSVWGQLLDVAEHLGYDFKNNEFEKGKKDI